MVAFALVGVGCGEGSEQSGGASTTESSVVHDGSDPEGAFCAAVSELGRTDGTTDQSVVLAAIGEMRRNAPADISDDVNRSLDSLVVGNYPSAADPSMEEMPLEERQAAAARMMAYVEQHCVDSSAETVDP
ncbi:MAG TPA: hypothetical protein VIR30_15400 [Nocardioides sp.]